MTCHRMCDQQRQPCPSAWLCEMGCNFTNAKKETPRDQAERQFIEMEFPIDMAPDLFDEAIAWIQRWAKHVAVACGAVALTIFCLGAFV